MFLFYFNKQLLYPWVFNFFLVVCYYYLFIIIYKTVWIIELYIFYVLKLKFCVLFFSKGFNNNNIISL